ncbi:DUF2182 domain-containing protein [Aurantimonas sp. HBX-1]|uniref:DUF2182 domain-containing protein n=1 Tax=Aurantimonas sp. HBX-1 TaxID=2906072 RepID=UPI001F19EACB|nr:DUF2182 domain-containing protein [Aurantimonas sp. HBX-1]UIJ73437.1 DUF2182 domain-containing protein [Aurantimonas sp. HBX-1]
MAEATPQTSAVELIIRRDRLVMLTGLVTLAMLAWAWLLVGAGTGMDIWTMSRPAIFPGGEAGMTMPAVAWSPATWFVIVGMWWIMMIAMMIPSVAPMVLLHARVSRHAQSRGQIAAGAIPSGFFLGGYLLVWLAFSLVATILQFACERLGLLSQPMMWSVSVWLTAALLVAAGLYQLSPFKQVCLDHCRSPAEFLSRHWQKGRAGAFHMGVKHGAYCLGCCWALMALLFVGGIMNVYWIAGLAIVVLLEKLLPRGDRFALAFGLMFVAAGTWIAIRAV